VISAKRRGNPRGHDVSFRCNQSGPPCHADDDRRGGPASVSTVTVARARAGERSRFAVGVAGVVVAHLAGYAVAFPEPSERAQALAATGHGYWHLALLAAVAAGACAVVAAFRRGVVHVRGMVPGPLGGGPHDRTGRTDRADRTDRVAGWLALARFQVLLFTAMEIGERFVAGHPALSVVHERTFVFGVVLQVVVAAVAVVVLTLVERTGAQVAMSMIRRRVGATASRPPWPASVSKVGAAGTRTSLHARAPPVPG
jgi:hypothetical protein